MKIVIILLFAILSMEIIAQELDVVISVTNINDTCSYGESLIFRDTDKNGQHDIVRRTFCDFSSKEDKLKIIGTGKLLSGMKGVLIDGKFNSNYYKIKIIDPFADVVHAFLTFNAKDDFALLDFVPTFVYNNKKNKIYLYPNPTRNSLLIKQSNLKHNGFWEIFSSNGILLLSGKINNNEIDVSDLSPGVYFILINKNIYKFVKI
jgi:hypothetical protein